MRRLLYILPLGLTALFASGADPNPLLEQIEREGVTLSPEAMYRVSYYLETGRDGIPRDSVRADSLLRASAEAGYAPACNLLGYRYYGVSPDSMLLWIERAATAVEPDPKAYNNLGWLLATGSGGVRRDMRKAVYWYERGAEAGVPAAMTSLAELLMEGVHMPADTTRAKALLHSAAAAGFKPAGEKLWLLVGPQITTGEQALREGLEYYREGIYTVSAPLFMQAAGEDNPYALALLAQSYADGRGVPYDYGHAMHLFWHSALLGDPSAAYIVGEMLEQFPDAFADESRTDEQHRTASEWIAEAAAGGVHDAHEAMLRLQ